jgi:hypothetical protein
MKTIILIVLAVTVAPFLRADSFAGEYTATSGSGILPAHC